MSDVLVNVLQRKAGNYEMSRRPHKIKEMVRKELDRYEDATCNRTHPLWSLNSCSIES